MKEPISKMEQMVARRALRLSVERMILDAAEKLRAHQPTSFLPALAQQAYALAQYRNVHATLHEAVLWWPARGSSDERREHERREAGLILAVADLLDGRAARPAPVTRPALLLIKGGQS